MSDAETAHALIARLRAADVRLVLDGGKLRVNAPKGALTDELRAAIGAHRESLIEALTSGGKGSPPRDRKRISRSSPLPVSSAQQRLWFLDRMAPGTPLYNIGGSIRIRGRLDRASFERAVGALVGRHESLRTHFAEQDGAPVAVIAESGRPDFEFRDVSHLPAEEATAAAIEASNDAVRAPFDVARGPLARFYLVRVSADHHIFTICLHHIVADGWSLQIAVHEIVRLYEKLVAGLPPELPALAREYVDYAGWEREQLASGGLSRDLAYWRGALAGAPSFLELPTDRPRATNPSARGHRFRKLLDTRLVTAVKQVSREQEATLFMTLLSAFQVLLHRYSGELDLVVGSPVANRSTSADLEGIIGCFVNNIALRSRITREQTFSDMLRAVKATTLGALEHHELPFDVLVEAMKPARNVDRAPIFQVLFTLQTYLTSMPTAEGISLTPLDAADLGVARFELALELAEFEGEFVALYEYSTELFDVETIERLHGHFERILAAIAADPHQRIDAMPLLTASERALILDKWNETSFEHDRSLCVHTLLESAVRTSSEKTAVIAGDALLTYRELDERANRLAHLLSKRGVTPGSLVAVCLERTVDIPVALAAVLKCGAAYVPLDPAHPTDRLRYVLTDAAVAVAITLKRFSSRLSGAALVELDEGGTETELDAMPAIPVGVTVRPEDRAYVIYTSGSTGKPKGVEVEHRNVVSFLADMRVAPGFTAADRLLAVTTLSFDIAGLEFWLPLSTGGTVVVGSRTDLLEGERLAALLEEQRITVVQATPATFRLLVESGWAGKRDLKVLCGGEAMPRDLAGALLERVGELWNMYGPTETTIWSAVSRVADARAPIPIGRPIQNTRLYILEPSGLPAPVGVPGELCIAGEGVARGYLGRPELTAEKFVTLSLPHGKTERAYRTGDVARYRADGSIDYLGRRDNQVKVRGYRIELGEIEAALSGHPGVKECVVSVSEPVPGEQKLVGYVVTGDATFDADAVRTTLRGKLPEYMVPSQFLILPALPLTPNGKIDRKALPSPSSFAPSRRGNTEASMTPTERRVAGSWREVLKIERVGLHDNFFDIGGHSLLLVRLHASLKREFGEDLRLVELFQWATVAAQAARLSSSAHADAAVERAQSRAARLADG
jgi:amino acid adenylation domain-containing protein